MSLATLPRGPKLTLSSLYWVTLYCAMRMSQAKDATSSSQSGDSPTRPSFARAAQLGPPTQLFTFTKRPILTGRFLSGSWSVSLPGCHPDSPKTTKTHFPWSSFLTPCCTPTVGKESSTAPFPFWFRKSRGVGPLILLLYREISKTHPQTLTKLFCVSGLILDAGNTEVSESCAYPKRVHKY